MSDEKDRLGDKLHRGRRRARGSVGSSARRGDPGKAAAQVRQGDRLSAMRPEPGGSGRDRRRRDGVSEPARRMGRSGDARSASNASGKCGCDSSRVGGRTGFRRYRRRTEATSIPRRSIAPIAAHGSRRGLRSLRARRDWPGCPVPKITARGSIRTCWRKFAIALMAPQAIHGSFFVNLGSCRSTNIDARSAAASPVS